MSFEDQQISEYGGEPVLLFEFTEYQGARTWRYTDRAQPVVKDGDTFIPEIISIDKISQNLSQGPQGFNIRVPRSNVLAEEFKPYLPSKPILLRVMQRHVGDAQYITVFMAECASAAHGVDGFTTILSLPSLYKARRNVPWPMFCTNCNWGLFSPGCGLDKDDYVHTGTVGSVSGFEVTASVFGSEAAPYFQAGMIIRALTGEVRWITEHTGSVGTLAAPFAGLAPGETISVYPGCDGLENTCKVKFNNLPHFLGFPDIPTKNPFSDNVFGTGNSAAGAAKKKVVTAMFGKGGLVYN